LLFLLGNMAGKALDVYDSEGGGKKGMVGLG